MRRKEFKLTNQAEIDALLNAAEYGVLSTIDEAGFPQTLPVNFVWLEGKICFHGAKAGEKAANIARNAKAGFCVTRALSLIPSYFSDPVLACPATQYFVSIVIKGEVRVVEEAEEKARILNALMRKLQPEGGYAPLSADDDRYANMLKATAVYVLVPARLTAKAKLGQNLSKERLAGLIEQLEKRGGDNDRQTVALMKRFL